MNYITELKQVLSLTKSVYLNNFIKEANYVYVHERKLWTANTMDGVGDDELILFHTFKSSVPFDNIGIPTKELDGVLNSISEGASFTQHSDCIVITDGNKKITLPIVEYIEPPSIDLSGLTYTPLPSFEGISKRCLQFIDKTDVDGSKVHFTSDVITTDVNSIHTESVPMELSDFSVSIQTFSVMKEFSGIAVADYLYLKSDSGTILVTKHYPIMELDFIEELYQNIETKAVEVLPIIIPKVDATDLFKVFGVNTKKPDREVTVDINAQRIEISTGNDITGFVTVTTESVISNPVIKFTIGTEKLFELLKNYEKLSLTELAGEVVLWGVCVGYNKFIVIEEIE
jgi:hypothetical protein